LFSFLFRRRTLLHHSRLLGDWQETVFVEIFLPERERETVCEETAQTDRLMTFLCSLFLSLSSWPTRALVTAFCDGRRAEERSRQLRFADEQKERNFSRLKNSKQDDEIKTFLFILSRRCV
jgi:hypothetical protein